MPNWLKLVLAIIAGVVIGSLVNGGLIALSGQVIPPPPGVDLTTEEGLDAAMPLLRPEHFVFPFLAHALGTLVGAFVASKIAPVARHIPALIIGAIFLLGGLYMAKSLDAPLWFEALDILIAYIPAALLGHYLASRGRRLA